MTRADAEELARSYAAETGEPMTADDMIAAVAEMAAEDAASERCRMIRAAGARYTAPVEGLDALVAQARDLAAGSRPQALPLAADTWRVVYRCDGNAEGEAWAAEERATDRLRALVRFFRRHAFADLEVLHVELAR